MLIVNPDRRAMCPASLDRLPGQNMTSCGSRETEETALAVMASTSWSARATMTATPVANNPTVSRKRRASMGSSALLIACGGRAESLVPTFLHECPDFLGTLLDLRGMAGHECARHANRIAEEKPLVQHLASRERRDRSVPRQAEEGDAIECLRTGGLVVLPDVLDE